MEFAEKLRGYRSVYLTGMAPEEGSRAKDEREDFARQLSRQLNVPAPRSDDWNTLFWSLAEKTKKGKWVVILDEINWLGGKDPTFLGKLKSAWDRDFSKNNKLILILSGSLTGWIKKNILHSTGFVGRIHLDMTLDELPLRHCEPFLSAGHDYLSDYEKLKILSVTGGIPSYLERIDTSLSAEVNIQRLCFEKEGFLFREFENLFHDLFQKKNFYRQVIEAVAEKPLDLEGIYKKLNIQKSGYISDCIGELIQSGFLARHYTWNIKTKSMSKLSTVRICDNYTRFYFKCIQPNKPMIERGNNKLPLNINSILGLQFENLILNNRSAIWSTLGLRAEDIVFDNPYFQKPTRKSKGCQIDYMIQCQNNTVYVCEIKFRKNSIPYSIISEVKSKIQRIAKPRNFSFRPVIIHINGVDESVITERYFDEVIDFGGLWNGASN